MTHQKKGFDHNVQPSGTCPMRENPSSNWHWTTWFSRHSNEVEVTSQSASSNSCPRYGQSEEPVPASVEEASEYAQIPHSDQTIPLSTRRAISSIPKPYESPSTLTQAPVITTTTHQPENSSKWVYPSEQQFLNAMKRKGWDLPSHVEKTIPMVVQIHNAVNERSWGEVLKWENLRGNQNPRLVKFIGRPNDLSPKAKICSTLSLRNQPFDRHDWYVDKGDGTGLRRYVIDFYNGKEGTEHIKQKMINEMPNMFLDVRPALDDVESVKDRVKMTVGDCFPGIYRFIRNNNSINSHNQFDKKE